MNIYYYAILVLSITYLFSLNFLFKKFNFLIDKNNSNYIHKAFVNNKNNNVPLSGGIFILTYIIFLKFEYTYYLLLIYILGLSSDIDILKSPKIRIFFQLFIVSSLLIHKNIYIPEIRIEFVNNLFDKYRITAIIFSIFCLLILINGGNFIDGVNNLLSGYFLVVLAFISLAVDKNELIFNSEKYKAIFFILLIFFIYNFFNKSFLGDGGSYLLSFLMGISAINFIQENTKVSPYFIMNLLWYPAFENFFSIIRRLYRDSKTSISDNMHLHHIIFFYLTKKFKINSYFISSCTGILINFFNSIIFYYSIQNIYSTKFQLTITVLSILIYLSSYYFFFNWYAKFRKII